MKTEAPIVVQIIANPHTGNVMALDNQGQLYERELDNTPQVGHPARRNYKWHKAKGPFDE